MSPLGILPHSKGGVLPHLEEFNKHPALRHNPYVGRTVTTHNGSEHFILPALWRSCLSGVFCEFRGPCSGWYFLLKKVSKVVNINAYHVILSRINCDVASKYKQPKEHFKIPNSVFYLWRHRLWRRGHLTPRGRLAPPYSTWVLVTNYLCPCDRII